MDRRVAERMRCGPAGRLKAHAGSIRCLILGPCGSSPAPQPNAKARYPRWLYAFLGRTTIQRGPAVAARKKSEIRRTIMNPLARSQTANAPCSLATSRTSHTAELIGHVDVINYKPSQPASPRLTTSKALAHSSGGLARQGEGTPRDNEQQYVNILNATTDAIIAVDQDQRITLFNRAAEDLFCCTAASVIGQVFDRFIPARLRDVMRNYLQDTDRVRPRCVPAELTALRTGGEEFPIEGAVSPVRFNDYIGHMIILRDAKERAQAGTCVPSLQSRRESSCGGKRRRPAFMGMMGEAPGMQA